MADTMDTYRTLTPYLVVADADAEMRFLKAALAPQRLLPAQLRSDCDACRADRRQLDGDAGPGWP